MLEDLLKELKETWSYTTEELNDIREKMKSYAVVCLMDSEVRKEVSWATRIVVSRWGGCSLSVIIFSD